MEFCHCALNRHRGKNPSAFRETEGRIVLNRPESAKETLKAQDNLLRDRSHNCSRNSSQSSAYVSSDSMSARSEGYGDGANELLLIASYSFRQGIGSEADFLSRPKLVTTVLTTWDVCSTITGAVAVIAANVCLRPIGKALNRGTGTADVDITYLFRITARSDQEAHMRVLLLHSLRGQPLLLKSLKSDDLERKRQRRSASHSDQHC